MGDFPRNYFFALQRFICRYLYIVCRYLLGLPSATHSFVMYSVCCDQVALLVLLSPCSAEGQNSKLSSLASRKHSNNTIILMIGTSGYLEFLKNTACRLQQLGIEHFVIGAVDEDTLAFCSKAQLPAFSMSEIGSEYMPENSEALFNTMEFRMIVRHKQLALHALLQMDYSVILLDLDMFLLRDPTAYLGSLPEHDFIIQSGTRTRLQSYMWINAGLLFVRPTKPAIGALDMIMEKTQDGVEREGQAVNEVLCGLGSFHVGVSTCEEPVVGAQTLVLDRTLFINGDVFIKDFSPPLALLANPYVVHFSHFRYESKLIVMKEMGMWTVDGLSSDLVCKPFVLKEQFDMQLVLSYLMPSHEPIVEYTMPIGEFLYVVLVGFWGIWASCIVCICLCCWCKGCSGQRRQVKPRLE